MKSSKFEGGDVCLVSHPSRGAWIEIAMTARGIGGAASHPSRGAWIEINYATCRGIWGIVAPLTGCVD